MGLVNLDSDSDNLVTPGYSTGKGPVLRGERLEFVRIRYEKGGGAKAHSHPEEQVFYVLSGRSRETVGGETYEVGPGEAVYYPPGVEHATEVLEDMVALSIKVVVDPIYDATGKLS